MKGSVLLLSRNGQPALRRAIPEASLPLLIATVADLVAEGKRLAALFVAPRGDAEALDLHAVLADDARGWLGIGRAAIAGRAYEALTPQCPQAHWFEREIAEQYGVTVEGHPWMKPIRFQPRMPGAPAAPTPVPGVARFYRVQGHEVHEVAVGPIHAGVIEPGHFRFQCHGERVFHLEISLGYQHRGVERAALGGPHKRTIHHMETLAGDTSIGHGMAYCQALEGLSRTSVPARAQAIRGIALELERLANHTGDLGALAGDVAFLPTASFCGRLRGDFLNMTADLCGSRFGRGLVRPGGVGFDVESARGARLVTALDGAARDVEEAVGLLFETPSALARFERTGIVPREDAEAAGLVGPAARACGAARDVRHDFPTGIFQFAHVPVMTADDGDVYSRALVRWLEIRQSVEFVRERLLSLPATPVRAELKPLQADSVVVSLSEGWRGEVCHVALTDAAGRLERYKVVDPSFHNWFGLALALRDAEISDFPLCNKSFNLSYCGHDL